ncbi:hypothetical protein ONZ51_g11525 [Trametes cubensis]|uniref:Uncharacterized protein n=1 Tax=Trametes cubensis TaxID=1111947 RepID=A0AAD7X5D5_9APHY|nr:hypothetical protein ONZ51_g11525 [Trametes cubensis]
MFGLPRTGAMMPTAYATCAVPTEDSDQQLLMLEEDDVKTPSSKEAMGNADGLRDDPKEASARVQQAPFQHTHHYKAKRPMNWKCQYCYNEPRSVTTSDVLGIGPRGLQEFESSRGSEE